VPAADSIANRDARAADGRFADSTSSDDKLLINQAYENMGLARHSLLGETLLDGVARHTPEGNRVAKPKRWRAG